MPGGGARGRGGSSERGRRGRGCGGRLRGRSPAPAAAHRQLPHGVAAPAPSVPPVRPGAAPSRARTPAAPAAPSPTAAAPLPTASTAARPGTRPARPARAPPPPAASRPYVPAAPAPRPRAGGPGPGAARPPRPRSAPRPPAAPRPPGRTRPSAPRPPTRTAPGRSRPGCSPGSGRRGRASPASVTTRSEDRPPVANGIAGHRCGESIIRCSWLRAGSCDHGPPPAVRVVVRERRGRVRAVHVAERDRAAPGRPVVGVDVHLGDVHGRAGVERLGRRHALLQRRDVGQVRVGQLLVADDPSAQLTLGEVDEREVEMHQLVTVRVPELVQPLTQRAPRERVEVVEALGQEIRECPPPNRCGMQNRALPSPRVHALFPERSNNCAAKQ